ncbi:small s protein [Fusarium fujikuroi]|nr:small s protein [Fusarium fujikuroi]
MATGLEIVGTLAALYQLIDLSVEFITEWKAVYDGARTAESYMKEHAQNLAEACKLTQARYQTIGSYEKLSDTERGVQKTAKKCRASAQALLGELSFLETEQESNNCMGPVRYVVKSKLHRKKIEKIEARFKNNQQELQIILQSEILSQNKAMQYPEMERFASLEEDIRILIEQGSKGFFGLEAFIEAQHEATNKIVKSRLVATDNLIVQEFSKAQQGIKDSAAEVQRKEFLESFRYPEMNKRYNDILDSSDANFDRVFASYEKVTKHDQRSVLSKDDSSHPSSEASEYDPSHGDFSDIDSDELRAIDKSWSNFINWLKSRDSLFCIQGKPRSGKSTLIKFVIDNENTQRLLEHQSSDIVIMSHFFWKIGSEEQSTIKGFLCSLVHQLLAHSEHLQELAMRLYDTVSHKSYHDWSSKPLKSPLRQVLEAKSHAICVFVDGLDEVANDDGLDKLTREIEEILQFPGIKICVSSRPEASVVEWLERLNAPSILLEDLTRPEMSSYVHQGLDPLLSSKKLSMETHRYLCDEMVRKSQGVFLWLFLVLRSLIEGIENRDPDQILIKRLAELSSKIHDLYADLWERLNERSPVYRRDAVRFLQYVLTKQGQAIYFRLQEHPAEERFYVRQPVLGQIAFAEMPDRHGGLLKHGDRIDSKELQEACDMQEIKSKSSVVVYYIFASKKKEYHHMIPTTSSCSKWVLSTAQLMTSSPRQRLKINLAGRFCSQWP